MLNSMSQIYKCLVVLIAKLLNSIDATLIRIFTFLFTFYAICADFGKVFKRFSLQDKK